MNHKFEDVEVKENALELLKKELLKRPKSMIGTGTMTDPYIPLEKHLKYLKKSLNLIYRYGFGFTCITKSDLILRDLKILKKINEKSKVVVQMTLTTSDNDLCEILEPHVCSTTRRVEVLKTLQKQGIPTVVWLTPILPYINDDVENISSILDYCIDVDVKGIICFEMGMTLREGSRDYYYKKLDEYFPGLKDKYIKEFGNGYSIPSLNNKQLMSVFNEKTNKYDILNRPDEVFNYISHFPQNRFNLD